jgi:DNA-binding NtrC family response regulator
MAKRDYLSGKRILIVDDEPDILEILEELLPTCDTVKATTYEEAKDLLETQSFDMAILDIMGVDGYKLLEISGKRKVIPIMLTAHALSPENTVRSYREGAALYVPKEKITNIATYLEDVLEAKEKGKSFWWRWLDRFATYYDGKFGPRWQEPEKDIWEKMQFERVKRYYLHPHP